MRIVFDSHSAGARCSCIWGENGWVGTFRACGEEGTYPGEEKWVHTPQGCGHGRLSQTERENVRTYRERHVTRLRAKGTIRYIIVICGCDNMSHPPCKITLDNLEIRDIINPCPTPPQASKIAYMVVRYPVSPPRGGPIRSRFVLHVFVCFCVFDSHGG